MPALLTTPNNRFLLRVGVTRHNPIHNTPPDPQLILSQYEGVGANSHNKFQKRKLVYIHNFTGFAFFYRLGRHSMWFISQKNCKVSEKFPHRCQTFFLYFFDTTVKIANLVRCEIRREMMMMFDCFSFSIHSKKADMWRTIFEKTSDVPGNNNKNNTQRTQKVKFYEKY